MEKFEKIKDLKATIKDGFHSFFENENLLREPSKPLLASNIDDSVIFIGSSTNVFKKYLNDSSVPDKGVYLWQNKIRTQNYRYFLYTSSA